MTPTIDIPTLRKAALAATPGPWEYAGRDISDIECAECGEEFPQSGYRIRSKDEYQTLECHLFGMELFAKPDGEFIALANPQTILALCDELERLRELAGESGEVRA